MTAGRPSDFAVTTKDPQYIRVRNRADQAEWIPDANDVAMLLGINVKTVRLWASTGRLGAVKQSDGSYTFDLNLVRAEMGLDPLPRND
jgi:hypothetical protein